MKLQLKQNYTARQRGILNAFKEKEEATIDEIRDAMEKEVQAMRRITSFENATTQLKQLAMKLAQEGIALKRVSGKGRGQRGVWKLEQIGERK